MCDVYRQLLEASIAHLERLRDEGVRYVQADPEVLSQLRKPSSPPAQAPVAPVAPSPPAGRRSLSAMVEELGDPVNSPHRQRTPKGTPAVPAPAPVLPPSLDAVPPLSPQEKEVAMAELRTRVLACRKCEHLAKARRNVVFGVGDVHSRLMFVGEAPGSDEDAQGEPFVGAAGQLLTKIIQTMGLSRAQVYIANILKCRPDTPGQLSGNRKPTPGEMATCFPYLQEQIRIIRPGVIVALGATAVEGLFGKTEGITRLRGKWNVYMGTPVMPTYHPAYLLRNQALSEKRKVWEDMLQVMEKLAMPITEKQRAFFQKS